MVGARPTNGGSGSQTTENQHSGVECTKPLVQEVVTVNEVLGMNRAVNDVRNEQATEEQDFCNQEQPHPQLSAVELLLGCIEVVRQP